MRRALRKALSLQEEPFFRDFSPGVVGRLESFVYHREYETRQIIFFPDDPCDYVYWVRSGRIRLTRVAADHREFTFHHLVSGDILGEEGLIERPRRECYAEAMEPTVLCLMRTDDYRRFMHEDVELACKVAEALARRVTESEAVLADTVFHSVRVRVAAGLLRLVRCERGRTPAVLRVTHQELANLVGSTRETTTLMLHALRSEGLIELGNRRITVVDPEALAHIARPA